MEVSNSKRLSCIIFNSIVETKIALSEVPTGCIFVDVEESY